MRGDNARDHEAIVKTYLDERRALTDAEEKSTEQFDKGILTLAAGALAISLVFIEKIAPEPKPCSIPLLTIAWSSFVTSILFTLVSFLTSLHAYRRQREIVDALYDSKPDSKPIDQKNRCAAVTMVLNWISIASFIIGAGFLVWFSVENLHHRGGRNGKEQSTATTTPGKAP